MKVALVGNMNNMYFSFMRYLRDLGIDAYLFRFNSEEIFKPEHDSWNIKRWGQYIKTLPFGTRASDLSSTSPKSIKEIFSSYDITIGCGMAPAYFAKAGLQLDIFYPYSMGIEWYSLYKHNEYNDGVKELQVKGIKQANICLTMGDPQTIESYQKLGIIPLGLNIPLVYIEKNDNPPEDVKKAIKIIRSRDFKVFFPTRHVWKNVPAHYKGGGKKNHIMIKGFAKYLKQTDLNAVLIMCEYGLDIKASKELVHNLGIKDNVLWLPPMERKALYKILSYVNLCADQFGTGVFASVAFESMSKGKPVLNYVKWKEEQYQEIMGHPLPPIINVKTTEDISAKLKLLEQDLICYKEAAEASQEWYDRYHGIELAKKHKRIIEELYKKKK